jgi:hypothetical protein
MDIHSCGSPKLNQSKQAPVVEVTPEDIEVQNTDSETVIPYSPEELKQQEAENAKNTMNSAIISADPTLCEEITIPEVQKECNEKSNLALAQKENDPTKCDFLTGS